jgi:hypothetical protein
VPQPSSHIMSRSSLARTSTTTSSSRASSNKMSPTPRVSGGGRSPSEARIESPRSLP